VRDPRNKGCAHERVPTRRARERTQCDYDNQRELIKQLLNISVGTSLYLLSSYDSVSFDRNEKSCTIPESIPNPIFGKKNRPYFQKKLSQVRI
jgi:hypothetical protein